MGYLKFFEISHQKEAVSSCSTKERLMDPAWVAVIIAAAALILQAIGTFPPKDKKPKDKDE
jgi:hypothetical protein